MAVVTAEQVLEVARAELGYKEKASNSNLDDKSANAGGANFTKYARDLYKAGYYGNGNKNGYAWCDVFVDWCFYVASGKNRNTAEYVECQTDVCGAGCLYSAQYYKQANRWSTKPSVGAQIFFSYAAGEVSHTGIVESFNSTTVTTIEGNTSDMVARRTYNINDSHIYGYGLPRYNETIKATSITTATTTTISVNRNNSTAVKYSVNGFRDIKLNCVGSDVGAMQTLLEYRGYSVGRCGVDSDCGNDTIDAIKKFQKANGLTSDGICGSKTWAKLIGIA